MIDGKPLVLVIDGQGGGVGRALTALLKEQLPQVYLRAVGSNAQATAAMLRAGAHDGATGENAVVVNAPLADFIVGPIGVAVPDSLLGEITPAMAAAVGASPARKILIPSDRCHLTLALDHPQSLQTSLERCAALVKEALDRRPGC